MSTPAQRLHPHARGYLNAALVGVDDPSLTTRAIVVDTLPEKVRLVERFNDFPAWAIHTFADLGPAWVVRWDILALWVPDPSDLKLARSAATQVAIARKRLRVDVVNTVDALGLRNRRVFLKPAPLPAAQAHTRQALEEARVEERERRRAEYWQEPTLGEWRA